ncbi:MAG: hypothetical protein MJ252_05770 [archaeon]|nr:hypothetical protein [archaeon]
MMGPKDDATKEKLYEKQLKYMTPQQQEKKYMDMARNLEIFKNKLTELEMVKSDTLQALEGEEENLRNLIQTRDQIFEEKGISRNVKENMKKEMKLRKNIKDTQVKEGRFQILCERKEILETQKEDLENKLRGLQERLEKIKAKNMAKKTYIDEQKLKIAQVKKEVEERKEALKAEVNEEAKLEKSFNIRYNKIASNKLKKNI